jgi:hypothetical protein
MWCVPVIHSVPSGLRARRAIRSHRTSRSRSFPKSHRANRVSALCFELSGISGEPRSRRTRGRVLTRRHAQQRRRTFIDLSSFVAIGHGPAAIPDRRANPRARRVHASDSPSRSSAIRSSSNSSRLPLTTIATMYEAVTPLSWPRSILNASAAGVRNCRPQPLRYSAKAIPLMKCGFFHLCVGCSTQVCG